MATEREPLLANHEDNVQPLSYTSPDHDENPRDISNQKTTLDEAARLAAIQALPWYRRPSIIWVLPFIFLVAIVMGLSQAPQEQLIIKIICRDIIKDKDAPAAPSSLILAQNGTSTHDDLCNTAAVQATAALVLGRIRSLKYIIAIFVVGHYNAMSDKLGRKFLIYITLVPAILTQLLVVYMAQPKSLLGIEALYVDAILVGLAGGGLLLDPGMSGYASDCTSRAGRSLAIGYMMVSLSVGMIIGPVLGGYLIELTDNILTALYLSSATLIFLVFYAIMIPESLPRYHGWVTENVDEQQQPVVVEYAKDSQDASFWTRIKDGLWKILDPMLIFLPGRLDTSDEVNVMPSPYTLMIIAGAFCLLQFAVFGFTIIFIPYTNLVFKWTTLEDGIYFSVNGAATFIVYVGIFPLLKKLYSRVVEKQSHGSSTDTDPAAKNRTTWNDLSFFIFGGVLYSIGYAIIPMFETVPILFLYSTLATITRKVDGMSRLQLQAACVKHGLASTGENEELKRLLREFWTQPDAENESDAIASVNGTGETVPDDIKQETKTAMTTGATDMVMKDVNDEPALTNTLPDVAVKEEAPEDEPQVKQEVVEESMSASAVLETPSEAKQEQKDITIKQEENEVGTRSVQEMKIKQEADTEMVVDTKTEDTTVPVMQRKQFWESKSGNTRSALPVSKARLNGQQTLTTAKVQKTKIPTMQTGQKRSRTADETDSTAEANAEDGQADQSVLPTPGTVRKLIGRFAGSSISSSESPTIKKRKIEPSKSPRPVRPSPPVISKYKRVIKIPVAGASSVKSAYAMGATRPGTAAKRSAVAVKQKTRADSTSDTAESGPSVPTSALSASTNKRANSSTTTKTVVSAETINRLAMPKKVISPSAQTSTPATVVPASSVPVPITPTRPRGPVLSTASRAAQRRNRDRK
ncbi:hypothetical protein BGZ51_006460 [Haplosporangium sp. Z 767]|nr:hypothetical protein BGZ51_006460 [Haplosporangium sp. Z 767]KAF9190876.1 hypothetical protein BGZ50_009754 [Haplosporangium sp. Z 11]